MKKYPNKLLILLAGILTVSQNALSSQIIDSYRIHEAIDQLDVIKVQELVQPGISASTKEKLIQIAEENIHEFRRGTKALINSPVDMTQLVIGAGAAGYGCKTIMGSAIFLAVVNLSGHRQLDSILFSLFGLAQGSFLTAAGLYFALRGWHATYAHKNLEKAHEIFLVIKHATVVPE